MKLTIYLLTLIFATGTIAQAQLPGLRQIKPKKNDVQKPSTNDESKAPVKDNVGRRDAYEDREFLLMGHNDLGGKSIGSMRACVVGGTSRRQHPPMSENFIAWSTSISETAALHSFEVKTCQVIAFWIEDHPGYKYNSIDALNETTQGNSIYRVDGDKLTLIRKVEGSQIYVVVVPDHDRPGLKLADLRVCGYPDTIKLYKRRVNSGSNCHDQKQKLYVFEKYKSYPGPMQTSSVMFDAAEFEQLNKQGKFKGLVVYKLVNDGLVPAK